MFTNRFQKWQRSTNWLKFVETLTNTLMFMGILLGIFFVAYLLKVWFAG